jgi:NifU-like protein involved in Fe-S cluster formation
MYSKETMKRFTNPKFVGEMKDADAVGQEGNVKCGDIMKIFLKIDEKTEKIKDIKFQTYGCLPPKEKVIISEGDWKEIEKVSKNEGVLNGDGNHTTIKKIHIRNYKGDLLKFIPFVSPYNNFYTTPEHPILCIQRSILKKSRFSSKNSWLRINHKELISTAPDYVEAGYLKKGDYLVFSYNKKIKDKKIYTKSFLRLIGYYLAEGYFSAKESTICFAFNKNEINYINEVKYLIKEILGKEAKSRIRENIEEVYVNSREFVKVLFKIAGKLARKKKLSGDIMLLPPKKQLEIIKTYLNGDGDTYKRRNNNSLTFRLATSSEQLAIQFQEILARNHIFSSITRRKQEGHIIEGRLIKGHDLFIVSYKEERNHKFVHITNNFFLVPIKDIKKEKYHGKVYNFEVSSKPNSYLVKGFVVHNCVAAIAASDAMCELAKGKTLQQALKIKYDDIVKELKDLPTVKVHCSVLGTKALKNAIENYCKRKKCLKKI